MKKIVLLILCLIFCKLNVYAAKFPTEIKDYITNAVPNVDIRFDGVVIFPDNTVYLPLYPSLFSDVKKINIKQTIPQNTNINKNPDVIIFNNDFVLLKVITNGEGQRTVAHLSQPPLQVRTGLLPQDMLVPSGLIIPENLKGIIGNLKIDTLNEDIIKIENEDGYEDFLLDGEPDIPQSLVSQLKNKVLFVTTNISRNIQVLEPAKSVPSYALQQKSIPINVKAVNKGKFLLVTTFDRPFLDVISVADSRFIKQIDLNSNPEEILIDEKNNKAFITSPKTSNIFIVDIPSMSLEKKLKINGYCENLLLKDNKLFYVDKLTNNIWSIELNNAYLLKNIGSFPNVSAIEFANNRIFISSRTKSRIAVVDYETLGLINEFTTVNKPVDMYIFNDILYVLGAQNNVVQKIDIRNGNNLGLIELNTGGFSSGLNKLENSNIAVITDLKTNKYTLIDLSKGKLIKTYSINVPIKEVIITDKVKMFD